MAPSAETCNLDGKVAVVTGAGRGIGRAIALAYAQAGAAVACAARTAAEIAETAQRIRESGGGRPGVPAHGPDLPPATTAVGYPRSVLCGLYIVGLDARGG